MAFVDSSAQVSGSLGGVPAGAGVQGQANANATIRTPPGSAGYGGSWSVRTWVFIYLGFIVAFLALTGVLFNGKGRK